MRSESRGQLNLADEVRVARHQASGHTPFAVLLFLALGSQTPLQQGLVAGARNKELDGFFVDDFLTDGERCDPAAMA